MIVNFKENPKIEIKPIAQWFFDNIFSIKFRIINLMNSGLLIL